MAQEIESFVKAAEAVLGNKGLMETDVKEMTPEALVGAFLVIDGLLKDKGALALRKKALGDRLKDLAKENGKVKDKEKGHQELVVAGNIVTREKRVATMPDEAGLKALIEKTKGVEMKDVTTIVKTVKTDASKIKALVTLGKLDEKKVEKLRAVTWALKVAAGEGLKGLLESAGLVPAKKK